MSNRIIAIMSIVVSVASLVIGAYSLEGVMISASILATCYSSIILIKCRERLYKWSLLLSMIVAVCTILMTTLTSYENLVETGSMTNDEWTHVSAVVHTIPVVPLMLMTFFTFAFVFEASYNWALVSGLSVFVGLGVMVPGYVLLYAIQRAEINSGAITNAYVLFGLMIGLIQLIVSAVIIYRVFKGRGYLITSNGLEVRS